MNHLFSYTKENMATKVYIWDRGIVMYGEVYSGFSSEHIILLPFIYCELLLRFFLFVCFMLHIIPSCSDTPKYKTNSTVILKFRIYHSPLLHLHSTYDLWQITTLHWIIISCPMRGYRDWPESRQCSLKLISWDVLKLIF